MSQCIRALVVRRKQKWNEENADSRVYKCVVGNGSRDPSNGQRERERDARS